MSIDQNKDTSGKVRNAPSYMPGKITIILSDGTKKVLSSKEYKKYKLLEKDKKVA